MKNENFRKERHKKKTKDVWIAQNT